MSDARTTAAVRHACSRGSLCEYPACHCQTVPLTVRAALQAAAEWDAAHGEPRHVGVGMSDRSVPC